MTPLHVAQKVEPPPALVQQMANALLIECWRVGNAAVVLTRENVETADQSPDYRWHLSVAHPERKPTEAEVEVAIEKLPPDVPFGVELKPGDQIDVWEVKDVPLAKHWHRDREAASGSD